MPLSCTQNLRSAASGLLLFVEDALSKRGKARGGRTRRGHASGGWDLFTRRRGRLHQRRRTTAREQELLRTDVGLGTAAVARPANGLKCRALLHIPTPSQVVRRVQGVAPEPHDLAAGRLAVL